MNSSEKSWSITSRVAENFFDVSVLNQMNHTKMFKAFMKKGIVIALDIHDRSRYDKNYGDELARGRYLNGTCLYERYLTIQCVMNNMRLNLGVVLVRALESVAESMPKILEKYVMLGIPTKLISLDRGFFSTDVMKYLDDNDIPFLIPCKNTDIVVDIT